MMGTQALVHERRTLMIQDAADTATQELCGCVGDTGFDMVSHMVLSHCVTAVSSALTNSKGMCCPIWVP
jgi:hypothetical protein